MKTRITQTNALRSLLYEFGATFAKGKRALIKKNETALEELAHTLPQMVRDNLHVAQAAKIAPTIWAITANAQCYDKGFKSIRPKRHDAEGVQTSQGNLTNPQTRPNIRTQPTSSQSSAISACYPGGLHTGPFNRT